MKPLVLDEIVPHDRYEELRPAYREAVIAHKRRRRLALGEKVTLLFEDRETLRFQVQEMVRVETIRDPRKIQHELDVYNELMPGLRELSATLFIEITDAPEIRPELDRLVGLDEHVALGLGSGEDTEWIAARFDPSQMDEDRISAVHYLRFPLDEAQARRLAEPAVTARLRADHPHYRREVEIPAAVRQSLADDLAGDPEPLLEPGAGAAVSREPRFETGRVRARSLGEEPEHVVVEPLEPVASLLVAEDDLVHELLTVVKRVAAAMVVQHGGCRIHTDVGAGSEGLRWHVRAPGDGRRQR